MSRLKKLSDAIALNFKEREELATKVADAESKNDAAAVAPLKTLYEGKSLEFVNLNAQLARENDLIEQRKVSDQAKKLAEVIAPGSVEIEGKNEKVDATAKDEEKEEIELCKKYTQYLYEGKTSDMATGALQPQSPSWKKGKLGLAMPRRMAKLVMPDVFSEAKALPMTSVSSTGNQLMPTQYASDLLKYPGEQARVFQQTRRVPLIGGKGIWPKLKQGSGGDQYGAVAVDWTAEGDAPADTEAKFEQVTVECFEIAGYTEISRTLSNRSTIDLPMTVSDLFRQSLMNKVDIAIISGNGTGKPKGILAYSTINLVARRAQGTVDWLDLINLEHALPIEARMNAVYIVCDDVLKIMKQATDDMGRPLMPINPLTGKQDTLNGYRYIATKRTTLGALGDVIFADLSQYLTAVEQEIVIASSEHFQFKKGVISWIVYMLIGGQVGVDQAFAALKAEIA